MKVTPENASACFALAQRFAVEIQRDRPRDESDLRLNLAALAKTLVAACTSMEVATEVVESILRHEERWPAPATLRRHLRELEYLEEDTAMKRSKDRPRPAEEEPTSSDIDQRMIALKAKLLPQEARDMSKEICQVKTEAEIESILSKYHSMLPTRLQSSNE